MQAKRSAVYRLVDPAHAIALESWQMPAGLGTNPLTPLPPAAVGPILLAEGYASVAADWHMEWMLPERLEEGLEAR